MKPADFKKDLIRGKEAESKFLLLYPKLQQTSGFKGDFLIPNGKLLELKCDLYSPHKWPNFIMERWSRKGKPGGPWQAKEHGCHYFAYWFGNYDLLYIFEIDTLLKLLEKLIIDYELEDKANYGYTTQFYRLPRSLFEDIVVSDKILGAKNVK